MHPFFWIFFCADILQSLNPTNYQSAVYMLDFSLQVGGNLPTLRLVRIHFFKECNCACLAKRPIEDLFLKFDGFVTIISFSYFRIFSFTFQICFLLHFFILFRFPRLPRSASEEKPSVAKYVGETLSGGRCRHRKGPSRSAARLNDACST